MPADALNRVETIHGLGRHLRDDQPAHEELESLLEEAVRTEEGEPGEEEKAVLRARLGSRAEALVDGGDRLAAALPGFQPGQVRACLRLLRLAAGAGEDVSPEDPDALLAAAYRRYGGEDHHEEGADGESRAARARGRLAAAGRNDRCPCGSGEKYKDCHWVEDLRVTR